MELIIIAGGIWFVVWLVRAKQKEAQQPPTRPRVTTTVTGPRPRTKKATDSPGLFALGAFGRAGKPLDAPYAVIDIETTGFAPPRDRIIELAVVNMTPGGVITGEWSTVLHGNGATGGSKIRKLPPSKRKTAPGFEDIVDEFLAKISGHIVVAHNASFEERFLASELARTGYNAGALPALCSLILARRALPHLGGHKLEQCCHETGVELVGAHTALGDARAVACLLPSLLARTGPPRYRAGPVQFPETVASRALPRSA